MSLLRSLSTIVGEAFAALDLDPALGEVVVSQRPELGQFQCNGALAAAKAAGMAPRQLAESVVARLEGDDRLAAVTIAGPGFINVSVTDEHLAAWVEAAAAGVRGGLEPAAEPRSIVLDYGGPNVAKDLHVGHLRPALIGESLKRILRLTGHEVVGDVHLGDWGLPMGQLLAALADAHPDWPYFAEGAEGPFPAESPVTIDDLQEIYPRAAARAKEDPAFLAAAQAATAALQAGRPGYLALWAHFRSESVTALRQVYDALGVEFERWDGEATVAPGIEPMVADLRANGTAVESDGALVIEVDEPADTVEVPPLILLNSRGGATYGATDLATLVDRVGPQGADEVRYVVDLRQSLHFKQVFRAARKGGIVPPEVRLEHVGNGTVNGPDGKPFKTRSGDLPRLRTLLSDVEELARKRLDEGELALALPPEERSEVIRLVGLAALKFGELSNHRTTDYSFDLERFTLLQGRTGPYLQYVVVRTRSILERAASEGAEAGPFVAPTVDAERDLALTLLRWPEAVERAQAQSAPNVVAEYAYDLAGAFNSFYDRCHILREPDLARRGSWLSLVALARLVLVEALQALTIDVVDRM